METKTFEENLKKLEEIVRSLENKDITLEDAVKNYTTGLELSKTCYDILNTNEQLVVQKMTESGLVDFNSDKE
ncbi:MAG: exodeoxyribonuclease VII small subunit [Anaeroplasmataceae bacterium]|nr:exodeoxyribonuclease VII small subunit [Anaeroplasmataceae bacterium]MDE5856244.1 exodeoxyribonuclease VII small subunit [Anaeroplasmataceae bacterium]MDE6047897.1 exodeoxyribonuclease VII small subunit [Anaeroplasmataceae bacterium]MDE6241640.1 exodeoxyribonuclease VII small subunit [Anaeroplasmataceae bacterium]MDE7385320.1 exodeoxyribonuclease VII small subunit [Anaeroplasmataceae bacterium]